MERSQLITAPKLLLQRQSRPSTAAATRHLFNGFAIFFGEFLASD